METSIWLRKCLTAAVMFREGKTLQKWPWDQVWHSSFPVFVDSDLQHGCREMTGWSVRMRDCKVKQTPKKNPVQTVGRVRLNMSCWSRGHCMHNQTPQRWCVDLNQLSLLIPRGYVSYKLQKQFSCHNQSGTHTQKRILSKSLGVAFPRLTIYLLRL